MVLIEGSYSFLMERCLLRYQSHWFTFSFRLALFKKCLFSQSHRGSPVSYLGSCLDFPPCRPHFCIPLPSGVIFLSLHLSSILAQTFPPLQGTLVSAPVLVQNPGSKASPARASPSACSPHVGGGAQGQSPWASSTTDHTAAFPARSNVSRENGAQVTPAPSEILA